jgi:hypothetical protein
MERRERALNIGHELETNRGGHHVRHRASTQVNDPPLDTEFEKSQLLLRRLLMWLSCY